MKEFVVSRSTLIVHPDRIQCIDDDDPVHGSMTYVLEPFSNRRGLVCEDRGYHLHPYKQSKEVFSFYIFYILYI